MPATPLEILFLRSLVTYLQMRDMADLEDQGRCRSNISIICAEPASLVIVSGSKSPSVLTEARKIEVEHKSSCRDGRGITQNCMGLA